MQEDVSEDYVKGFNHGYFFTKSNFTKLNTHLLKFKQMKEFAKIDDYFKGFEDGESAVYKEVVSSSIRVYKTKNN